MNSNPRVSVVMPVYNAERFLRESVASILGQTYADFELIAIDDGSTDGSRLILKEFAAKDGRIRVFSGPNKGIVGVLNDGVSHMRGSLLARMDADDVALPHRLERQIHFLNVHPECVAVGSSVFITDDEGNDIFIDEAPPEHSQIEEKLLNGIGAICHPTVMMRANAVRQVGGYREEYRLATEDMDLFLRLGEIGRLANIQQPLLRYRWHLASISHQKKNLIAASNARTAMLREAYRRRGMDDRQVPMADLHVAEISERDLIVEHFYRWSFAAAESGRYVIARKYAFRALRLKPRSKRSWWILANSLVGSRMTGLLANCYRVLKTEASFVS